MSQADTSALESHINQLLTSRTHPKTICPSEAARAMTRAELQEAGAQHWRDTMPVARDILFAMRDRDEVEILQHGAVLESLEDLKGPIRARLKVHDEQKSLTHAQGEKVEAK